MLRCTERAAALERLLETKSQNGRLYLRQPGEIMIEMEKPAFNRAWWLSGECCVADERSLLALNMDRQRINGFVMADKWNVEG